MKRTTTPKEVKKPQPSIKVKEVHTYSIYQLKKILPKKQIRFCHYYIRRYNGTDSYLKAYGGKMKRKSARVNASKLLAKNNIQQYIAFIEKDIAKEVGISKIDFLTDLTHIAKADISDFFKDDWISRSTLNEVKLKDPNITKAIQETSTKIVHKIDPISGSPFTEEYVKLKFYDKLRATELIFRAMGWNEPEQVEVKQETTTTVDITKYNKEETALLLKMARKNKIL